MAIQIDKEHLLTLSEACGRIPKKPHISSLHRWRLKGVRGIKLETCLIGGVRYTSTEAMQRFVEATTIAAEYRDKRNPASHLPEQARPHNQNADHRQRAAWDVLNRAGI